MEGVCYPALLPLPFPSHLYPLSSLPSQAGCCWGLAGPDVGGGEEVGFTLKMTPLFISQVVPVPGPGIGPGGPRGGGLRHPSSAQYTDLNLCGLLPACGPVAWQGGW